MERLKFDALLDEYAHAVFMAGQATEHESEIATNVVQVYRQKLIEAREALWKYAHSAGESR